MNKKLLQQQLKHAYNTVEYYKKAFDENNIYTDMQFSFYDIPLLKKDMVIDNEDMFISSSVKRKYYSGDLLLKRTSGSTGKCMNIYWLRSDFHASNLSAWKYRFKWYGISIKDIYVSFHSAIYQNGKIVYSPSFIIKNGNNISFNKTMLDESSIHQILKEIGIAKPIWMLVQPSILHALVSVASAKEIQILNSLKYIELIGEFLSDNTCKYFKDMLPDANFSNMYGTSETGCIALACPYGHNHILDNTYVEVLDNDYSLSQSESNEGNIVITSLKNTAMPLIRYCIGDRGKIKSSKCECGYEGWDISISLGRENDIIMLPNGIKKHSSILWQIVEEICDEYPNSISQFHFFQKAIDTFVIYLSLKDNYLNWKRVIEKSFQQAISKYLCDEIQCIFDYNILDILYGKNKLCFYSKGF